MELEPAGYRFGSLWLNKDTAEVTTDEGGVVTVLSDLMLRLLLFLIRHQTRIVSRRELAENVWRVPKGGAYTDAAIDKGVGRLRTLLPGRDRSQYVRPMGRRGYRFVASAHPVSATSHRGNANALIAIDLGSADSEAREAFDRGRFHWSRRQLAKAVECFKLALARDPSFAKCRAALAESYVLLGSFGSEAMSPLEAMPLAEEAARAAIRDDDRVAEAHTALGAVFGMFYWNFSEVCSSFERAFQRDPNYATAHHWYANFLAARGEFRRANEQIRIARALNPGSIVIQGTGGWISYFARDFKRGIAACRNALEMDKHAPYTYAYLGRNYLGLRDIDSAIEAFEAGRRTPTGRAFNLLPDLAYAYGAAGHASKAKAILRDMQSGERYASPYHVAVGYLGLNHVDETFRWLEQAFEQRSPSLIGLQVDQIFDSIRGDRRYLDLVRRVGYWSS